jgi:valyl-tRNA synthetase
MIGNACVQAMEAYDFSTTTQQLYAWWQYELCDVFIELMKPVMARDQATDAGKVLLVVTSTSQSDNPPQLLCSF